MCGEGKSVKLVPVAKSSARNVSEEPSSKLLRVTRARPETGRAIRGQDEAEVKLCGGLKRFCVHTFF